MEVVSCRLEWSTHLSPHSRNVTLPTLPTATPSLLFDVENAISNLQWLDFALRIDAIPLRYVSPMKETFPLHKLVCAECHPQRKPVVSS